MGGRPGWNKEYWKRLDRETERKLRTTCPKCGSTRPTTTSSSASGAAAVASTPGRSRGWGKACPGGSGCSGGWGSEPSRLKRNHLPRVAGRAPMRRPEGTSHRRGHSAVVGVQGDVVCHRLDAVRERCPWPRPAPPEVMSGIVVHPVADRHHLVE